MIKNKKPNEDDFCDKVPATLNIDYESMRLLKASLGRFKLRFGCVCFFCSNVFLFCEWLDGWLADWLNLMTMMEWNKRTREKYTATTALCARKNWLSFM